MPQKIFISYRREDAGANALGISQYLEHGFGRKNVFIDVDMRAGTNFPAVLQQRLAECKVMLVLIGPEWLNARDEQGNRRLDFPDDWVRLEIARALKQKITVIPVRVNGATLPLRGALPEDIRGLLDHQAVSVTLAGFRNEMSGLVRDIRSIPSPKPWRRFGAIAAGLLLLLTVLGLAWSAVFTNVIERIRLTLSSQISKTGTQDLIWSSRPGEWVMYAIDNNPVAYYFKPSSIKVFGDRVAYAARWPVNSHAPPAPQEKTSARGAYEENITVLDCKKSTMLLAERTIFNSAGEIISHFKRGDPETLDFSLGEPVKRDTILSTAQTIMCDEQIRASVPSQLAKMKLTYLSPAPSGDGDVFYGPKKTIAGSPYQTETWFVVKSFKEHNFSDVFPAISNIVGLPTGYYIFAELLQINCSERKQRIHKMEYLDQENNLIYLALPPIQPMDVKDGSLFAMVLDAVCGPNVGGRYGGINYATYKSGGQGEQHIVISVEQTESNVKVSFQAAPGGEGKGTGTLADGRVASMTLESTAPGCPGSYDASFKFR